jgi:branched-chain amino acid transport system ATP-binding protein
LALADEGKRLVVDDLWVHYSGAEAVRGVGFHVDPGEVVALLGANGAGKSTILRVISGLHRPTSGAVHYGGDRLDGMAANEIVRLGVAHVMEGRRLFGRMTVRENLQLGQYQNWPAAKNDIGRALELFPELESMLHRRCYMLSGGQQQMVAVARALLPRPSILLLDEPSLGLAPIAVRRIMDVIATMRESGTAVLLVEQDTAVAVKAADRAIVMANGTFVATGTADQIAASDALHAAYLGTDGGPTSRPPVEEPSGATAVSIEGGGNGDV